MDGQSSKTNNVVIVDDSPTKSELSKMKQLKKLLMSKEAKMRTKKLFDKAMPREKENALAKGNDILDCEAIELNDSSDFSYQPSLRIERPLPKKKSKTGNDSRKIKVESRTGLVSMQSTSSPQAPNHRQSTSKSEDEVISIRIKESTISKDGRSCHLCHQEFGAPSFKDHIGTCLKQNFEHHKNASKNRSNSDPFKDKAPTKCHICKKDISYLNSSKQTLHINTCMDQEEKEKNQQKDHEDQLQKARSAVLSCPVCQKKFRSSVRRTTHLKKCAVENNMTVEQIKNLARQQEEEHRNQLDAGILPADTNVSAAKNAKGKSKGRKRNREEDEALQLAIALSTSLVAEKEQTQPPSTHTMKRSGSGNLLLNLPKVQASERISKRATELIFNASPPESVVQTPAFKRKKTEPDSHQSDKLWDRTSLTSPMRGVSSSGSSGLEQAPQPSTSAGSLLDHLHKMSSRPRPSYYVPSLVPPLTIDNSHVGSKLKRVSAIPGRKRSLETGSSIIEEEEDQVLSREEEFLGPPEEDTVDVPSQTVVDLAELAAEIPEEGSQFSDDSPSNVTVTKYTIGDPVNSFLHQPNIESSELKNLSTSLLSLVDCPEFCDIQITTRNGCLIPAHKMVLFARCPKLLEIGENGIIDLARYGKDAVVSVLKFIYGGQIHIWPDAVEDVIKLSTFLSLTSLLREVQDFKERIWKSKILFTETNGIANNAGSADVISTKEEDDISCTDHPLGENPEVGENPEGVHQVDNDHRQDVSNSDLPTVANEHNSQVAGEGLNRSEQIPATTSVGVNQADVAGETNGAVSPLDEMTKDAHQCLGKRDEDAGSSQLQLETDVALQDEDTKLKQSEQITEDQLLKETSDEELCASDTKLQIMDVELYQDNITSELMKTSSNHISSHDVKPMSLICEEQDKCVSTLSTHSEAKEDLAVKENKTATESKAVAIDVKLTAQPDPKMVQIQAEEQGACIELSPQTMVTAMLMSKVSQHDELSGPSNPLSLISPEKPPPHRSKPPSRNSKKVTKTIFKQLVSKAAVEELTEAEAAKIKIKIEQDDWLFNPNDSVYIPSVLDSLASHDSPELEITAEFIAPPKFKSKRHAITQAFKVPGSNSDISKSMSSSGKGQPEKQLIENRGMANATLDSASLIKSISHVQHLHASKTISSSDGEPMNKPPSKRSVENMLSTSCNSDSLFSGDDDLFEDNVDETCKSENSSDRHPVVASVSMNAAGAAPACLIPEATKNAPCTNRIDGGDGLCSSVTVDSNAKLQPIPKRGSMPSHSTQPPTDSQELKRKLISIIIKEFDRIRSAESLSQSQETEMDLDSEIVEQCPKGNGLAQQKLFHSKQAYAESTPESDPNQRDQQALKEKIPADLTLIRQNLSVSIATGDSDYSKTRKIPHSLNQVKNQVPSLLPNKFVINLETSSASVDTSHCLNNTTNTQDSYSDKSRPSSEGHYRRHKLGYAESCTSTIDKNNVHSSNKSQLQQCRRTLDYKEASPSLSKSRVSSVPEPKSTLSVSQFSSIETSCPPAGENPSGLSSSRSLKQYAGQTEAFMEGLMECYSSRTTGSVMSSFENKHLKGNSERSDFPVEIDTTSSGLASNTTKPSSVQTQPHHWSRASDLSFADSSSPAPAETSAVSPDNPTASLKANQSVTVDCHSPNPSPFTMAYSPLIKKNRGFVTRALTNVLNDLPHTDVSHESKKPDSFQDRWASEDSGTIKDDSKSQPRVSSPRGNKSPLPLRQRLGLPNPFGMKVQKSNTAANSKIPSTSSKETDAAFKSITTSQNKNVQSVRERASGLKNTAETYNSKGSKDQASKTPSAQMMMKAKGKGKEPSPFTPMAPYDDMNTPQLKNAVNKIGVRPMAKKRMRQLLKKVYEQTHQYESESDSDLETSPVKHARRDSPLQPVPKPVPKSNISPKRVKSPLEKKDSYHSSNTALGNLMSPTSSSSDDIVKDKEDDVLNSSQDSIESGVEDLAEESMLQGWPEEEDVNPTQLTQTGSESVTSRLLTFFSSTPDIYNRVLLYEPLELDVLKKRIAEAGIRIGMEKLRDFLDEQCITYSMKNMTNRNAQHQRGRPAKRGKVS